MKHRETVRQFIVGFLGVEALMVTVYTAELWRAPVAGMIAAPTVSTPLLMHYRVPFPEPDNSTSITDAVNSIVWSRAAGH
jgi:hypothetical protein